jgi:hypothetical protein
MINHHYIGLHILSHAKNRGSLCGGNSTLLPYRPLRISVKSRDQRLTAIIVRVGCKCGFKSPYLPGTWGDPYSLSPYYQAKSIRPPQTNDGVPIETIIPLSNPANKD